MWLYQNKVIEKIEDFPKNTFGFVYMTTHSPTGISYIGRKSLYHNIKKKLTKKELLEQSGPGRKLTTRVIQKESDWKIYYGSSKAIIEMLKEEKHEEFKREILELATNKKHLTYLECKYLFKYNVLEYPNKYFNDNILGKFFTKDFMS